MKCVLCYSGGLDSTILLYHLKYRLGNEVRCLSVDYGQRHLRELYAAKHICKLLDIEYEIVSLGDVSRILTGSSQTSSGIAVPEGHYAEESMKQTVVPNRNAILLSLATAWAISTKSDAVFYAAHAGDHTIYPDCREEFILPFAQAMKNADWHKVSIERPFINKTKTDIVILGNELGVPFHLTWSCYKGGTIHCGRCSTCVERLESFSCASVIDKTVYANEDFWKTTVKEFDNNG